MSKIRYYISTVLIWLLSTILLILYWNQIIGRSSAIFYKILYFSGFYLLIIYFSYPKKTRKIKDYLKTYGVMTLVLIVILLFGKFTNLIYLILQEGNLYVLQMILLPIVPLLLLFIIGLCLVMISVYKNKIFILINWIFIILLIIGIIYSGSILSQTCLKSDWKCYTKKALKNPNLCDDPFTVYYLSDSYNSCLGYLSFYSEDPKYCELIKDNYSSVSGIARKPRLLNPIVENYVKYEGVDKNVYYIDLSPEKLSDWKNNCKDWANYKKSHTEINFIDNSWEKTWGNDEDFRPNQLANNFGNIINLDIKPEENFMWQGIDKFSKISIDLCEKISTKDNSKGESIYNNPSLCLMYGGIFNKNKIFCEKINEINYSIEVSEFNKLSFEAQESYTKKYNKDILYNQCIKFVDYSSKSEYQSFFESKDSEIDDFKIELPEGRIWLGNEWLG